MDIRMLRYFIEVVRQQSFTRAAENLFVTQPTISKMLRNLEDELGTTLLIRQGRKLSLTDTGQAVYDKGRVILDNVQQLHSELSDIRQLNHGTLRLGIPPMVGMIMASPIAHFRQKYPGVELKISEFGGLKVQQAVQNGELDVAVTALPVEDEQHFTTLHVAQHPLCVVVPKGSEWADMGTISPAQLADVPLLIYNEDFSLSRQLMQMFSGLGITPRIAVRSGQWDFLAAMVQAQVGLAILPEPICQKLDSGLLCWRPLDSELHWALGMIWRNEGYLSHSAQAWITCCKNHWPPSGSL